MFRSRPLLVLLGCWFALGLILTAPSSRAQSDASPLQIGEQVVLTSDDYEGLALSPDGQWLAAQRLTNGELEICAIATDQLDAPRCTPFPGASIGPSSIAWSPDSARFAFTEDTLIRADDSDIWVLEVESGALTNLTDDGYDGGLLDAPDGIHLDLAPAWSPDGQEIAFARSDQEATTLMRAPLDGGDPVEIAAAADAPFAVPYGVRWLEDGTLLYTRSLAMRADNGVWSIDIEGGEPERRFDSDDAAALESQIGPPSLVEVSEQGHALLLAAGSETVFILLDLASGDAEIVEPPSGEEGIIATATFSPDGTRLLLSYQTNPDVQTQRLAVRDLATGSEQVIGDLELRLGALHYRSGLSWAENDLIFGAGGARRVLVARLETV